MDYYLNTSLFTSAFTFPTVVVDKHLKFAKGEHIKVLLYICRNMTVEIDEVEISKKIGISDYDLKEALLYWADAGILLPKENTAAFSQIRQKNVVKKAMKPQRSDVAKRGLEDAKIRYLLQETQVKLGRNLKSNETSTLVWLYDDEGLDVSLILLIVQYAVNHGKANIRFIENTAIDWINRGIDSLTLADEELRIMAETDQAWKTILSAFGLEKRKPSAKENEYARKWLIEWGFSKEMLIEAYEACVNSKSKFSMPYVAKVLENWHNKGYTKPEDIKSDIDDYESPNSYNLDLFEKMLNSKD